MRFSETRIETITLSDGLQRDIHIWEPEEKKAILFAIHGGMAHGGDYIGLGQYFKNKGFVTVAPDLRGHVRKISHVKKFDQLIDDTVEYLEWTKQEYKDLPIIIVGHSMGSLIATILGNRISDKRIKGYVKSSPYYENAVKVSPILIKMSHFLGKIVPKMVAPTPSLTDVLTHDVEITARHHKDEEDEIRGSGLTIRFVSELLKAQRPIRRMLEHWKYPVIYFIAGKDELADVEYNKDMLKVINQEIMQMEYYNENYHENFNELNRDEVFKRMEKWIETIL